MNCSLCTKRFVQSEKVSFGKNKNGKNYIVGVDANQIGRDTLKDHNIMATNSHTDVVDKEASLQKWLF